MKMFGGVAASLVEEFQGGVLGIGPVKGVVSVAFRR